MISSADKKKFAELCAVYSADDRENSGIGTYNEKRLHKILKDFVCDDPTGQEVRVGGYIADIVHDGSITEIQTGSFYPLRDKIAFYLSQTDFNVTVVAPLTVNKRIIRMDRESGAVIGSRRSPRSERPAGLLKEIFWLSDFISSPRLKIKLFMISSAEYRFSERVRYRKSGAYDSELFPQELEDIMVLDNAADYIDLIPATLREGGEFCAADFGKAMSLRGRAVYSSLNLMCAVGAVLKTGTDGRKALYRVADLSLT